MSSAAVNRTSTGNRILNGNPEMIFWRPTNASGSAARGRPYSISMNRTRRDAQNTSWDAPVNARDDHARAEMLVIVGTSAGASRPTRQTPPNTVLAISESSNQPRSRDSGASDAGTRLLRLVCARSVYGNQ